jgi:hypothetical protein
MAFFTFVFFPDTGLWETDFSGVGIGVLRPERSTRPSVAEFSSLTSGLQFFESVGCTAAATFLLLVDLDDLNLHSE